MTKNTTIFDRCHCGKYKRVDRAECVCCQPNDAFLDLPPCKVKSCGFHKPEFKSGCRLHDEKISNYFGNMLRCYKYRIIRAGKKSLERFGKKHEADNAWTQSELDNALALGYPLSSPTGK